MGNVKSKKVGGILISLFIFIMRVVFGEGNLKIGVVNIKKVFEESLEAKEIKSNLEKQQKELEKNILSMEKKMQELQEEIKQLSQQSLGMDSVTLDEKEKELTITRTMYEREKQKWAQRLRDKINRFTLELYNKYRNIIEEYGIKNQFTLIFKVEEKELVYDPTYPTDERIRPRSVLYFKNELDITQAIIDEVNKRYLEEKAAAASKK
ncbi:MAG: OmpH family outer membrane protein [Planctomycetota bacterium]